MSHFGELAGRLPELDLPPFQAVVVHHETHVVAVLDPDRFRWDCQHVLSTWHGDLDLRWC